MSFSCFFWFRLLFGQIWQFSKVLEKSRNPRWHIQDGRRLRTWRNHYIIWRHQIMLWTSKETFLDVKRWEIKRWNCSWSELLSSYMYLTVKIFKEKDHLKVLHWLSACCSPVLNCLYSINDNVRGRQLPKNRKKKFPARKTSFSHSQKLVPAKHKKKTPIRKIKLPQKFGVARCAS